LRLLGKKSAFPPLGLLTVGAMLPSHWEKKLIDMNTDRLEEKDIKWADYVFISAMIVQKETSKKVIALAKKFGKPVVAGGPLFTTGYEEFSEVDHLVLGEVEGYFHKVIKDLEDGKLKKMYKNDSFPDISKSVVPDWSLINTSYYNSMCLQFSRGCPFDCEFCDVVQLNGRVPRLKAVEQVLAELESLYRIGWRAGVFFVDDNLIGSKARLKKYYLPALIKWQKERKYPFSFNTQVSVNLADDRKLISSMAKAGFTSVFVGIETPDAEGLNECGKVQNKGRDLVESVKIIQNGGLEVQAGFIVGFDSDQPSIFQRQIDFIQKSGIVTAMVGILTALPKTRLYQRLEKSDRLVKKATGNNTGTGALNFIPKMDTDLLVEGYKKVTSTIYSPKCYYARIKTLLKEYKPVKVKTSKLKFYHIRAFLSSLWLLGIKQRGRTYFWKLILWSLIKKRDMFPYAIGFSLIGLHFRSLA
ncbi:MAG: B12-binding domain-containing radical SAM protein, partial [Actinomycetia bacterium]|nr:B12-binding domain-containing radical SAM protein [Actinomycetes bacterium]